MEEMHDIVYGKKDECVFTSFFKFLVEWECFFFRFF